MTRRLVRAMRRGTTVYSNYGLAGAQEFTCWEELADIGKAIVGLDEVGIWFGSRDWKNMPWEVLSWLAQSRKNGVSILWTAQSWEQVDVALRRLTGYRWQCERWGPVLMGTCSDPDTKRVYGRTTAWLRREVFEAYDTYRVVGSADGTVAGRRGRAAEKVAEELTGLYAVGMHGPESGLASSWTPAEVGHLWRDDITLVRSVNDKWCTVPSPLVVRWREMLVGEEEPAIAISEASSSQTA